MNPILERYDQDAADYERFWGPVLERSALRLLDFVEPHLPADGGALRALEVGVGTGKLLTAAASRWPAAELIATDGAAGMLELARARLDGAAGGRVTFHVAPADALPVDDAAVDLVFSTFVMQLVPDRPAALREAWRVLRPGGVIAYLTWLDRDSGEPFLPAEEFDEAVLELAIDEPETEPERHAGDVPSGRAATDELRSAGFVRASASEEMLEYDWTLESYLDYKLAYDERSLIDTLDERQRAELEARARKRLSLLTDRAFRWHAPVVFARAVKPR